MSIPYAQIGDNLVNLSQVTHFGVTQNVYGSSHELVVFFAGGGKALIATAATKHQIEAVRASVVSQLGISYTVVQVDLPVNTLAKNS